MSNTILNTNTELKKIGSTIDLFTYYVVSLFFIAKISIERLIENNVNIDQGELVFTDSFDDIETSLNSNGELLIKSSDGKDFSIDEDGYLIMEETI